MRRVILIFTVGTLLLALTATVAMAATLVGTNGDDWFFGPRHDDQMYGKGGDDIMQGMEGNDLMYGGYGNDYFSGDYGDDNLYDRHGSDYLYGNDGQDYINAKDGNRDHVNCGSGRDSFTADAVDVVRNCESPALKSSD